MSKNPWKTATVALGGVLLVALVAGAFMLGRTSTRTAGPPPAQQSTSGGPDSTTAAPEPAPSSSTARPYATTGAAIPKGEVVAGKGGIPDGPNGLHLKYPRTPEGAVAAATNYYTALLDTNLTTAQRKQIVKAIASSPEVEKGLNESLSVLDSGTPVAHLRRFPERGAYALAANAPDHMKVVLWMPTCKANGTDCSWGQSAIVLVWVKEDWKVYSPSFISEIEPDLSAITPKNPDKILTNVEKHELLKTPPDHPVEGNSLNEAYRLAWKEYANAAR